MIKQVLTVLRNVYHRRSSSAYLTYLRSIGVEIGEDVTIFLHSTPILMKRVRG